MFSTELFKTAIDNVMEISPGLQQDTRLYAGMLIDESLEIGETGIIKGFQSTSFFKDTAMEFAEGSEDRWVVEIYSKKGQKGKCMNGSRHTHLSTYPYENEYLLPRNQKYILIDKYIAENGMPVAKILLL